MSELDAGVADAGWSTNPLTSLNIGIENREVLIAGAGDRAEERLVVDVTELRPMAGRALPGSV